MNDIEYFDLEKYFLDMAADNRLANKHGFYPCTCSGVDSLQGVLDEFRKKANFICVEDTNDGATIQRGGGWFQKRIVTVFILARYRFNDMDDRREKLNTCRQIFRQFKSRMIVDKDRLDNELVTINLSRIMKKELSQYFISGCTGLYFMVEFDEPENLCYNEAEWE